MTVRLLLLGSPLVQHSGESIALPFERRTQLLAFLALKRAWVGRAELAAMLWPDQQTKLAYTNLRKTLHRVQSLPWSPQIEMQGGALRFQAGTDLFDFDLPSERIALRPASPRDAARLMVVRPGASPELEDRSVRDLPELLRAGDVLVVNDTKVIPARLKGRRVGRGPDATIEATLTKRLDGSRWSASRNAVIASAVSPAAPCARPRW